MSVSATVRFTVTVDVPIGSWNEAENFESLREVALREGANKLRNDLQKFAHKIIGQPKLITIMAAED